MEKMSKKCGKNVKKCEKNVAWALHEGNTQ